jgi:CelD/BcsL family acetyltransferase involved in cellulose biosynthesis
MNLHARSNGEDAFAIARTDALTALKVPPIAAPESPARIGPPPAASLRHLSAISASCDIKLDVHSDLDEVEQDWKIFESTANRSAFQTFDWIAKWQRHIGARIDAVPVIVLGRDSGGQLLFIMPFAIETRGPIRCLRWLGSRLCDYNAPLLSERLADHLDAGKFPRLWMEIVDLLRTDPHFHFDVIDLQKMPETAGTQKNPFLGLPVVPHPSGAYVATLGGDWNQYYAAKRSSATRKRERKQLKQLAEHGEVRFVDVQDRDGIERTVNTMIAQKSSLFRRMGVTDIFSLPGYREFYLDVATAPGARGLTHVSRLDIGSVVVAASLGLILNDWYYLILSSYQDGELSRFGPGRAHLNELLCFAIGRGFHSFDFTIGDEPYKRDWCDTELRVFDHLAAVSVRGLPAATVMAAFRRLKRFIKQTPTLWRVFSKARATVRRFGAGVRF